MELQMEEVYSQTPVRWQEGKEGSYQDLFRVMFCILYHT